MICPVCQTDWPKRPGQHSLKITWAHLLYTVLTRHNTNIRSCALIKSYGGSKLLISSLTGKRLELGLGTKNIFFGDLTVIKIRCIHSDID